MQSPNSSGYGIFKDEYTKLAKEYGGCHAHAINFNQDISQPYELDCQLQQHVIELGAYIQSEMRKIKDARIVSGIQQSV